MARANAFRYIVEPRHQKSPFSERRNAPIATKYAYCSWELGLVTFNSVYKTAWRWKANCLRTRELHNILLMDRCHEDSIVSCSCSLALLPPPPRHADEVPPRRGQSSTARSSTISTKRHLARLVQTKVPSRRGRLEHTCSTPTYGGWRKQGTPKYRPPNSRIPL